MSELCLSSTSKTARFSSLLIPHFFLFCSFITSHPLYFTCFIFFFPYFLKLLSFLSPLFITTSLLLLALLTVSPGFICRNLSNESSSRSGFLSAAYDVVVQRLRSKIDNQNEEFVSLEDFEVFKNVFDNPMIHDAKESQVEVLDAEFKDVISLQASEAPLLSCSGHQDFIFSSTEALENNIGSEIFAESETKSGKMEEKRLERFLQELDEFEKVTTTVEMKKIETCRTEANKNVEKQGEKSALRNGSEAAGNRIRHTNSVEVGKDNGTREYKSKLLKAHSHSVGASADYTNENGDYSWKVQSSPTLSDYSLGSYGSMRKEKDWKRTLACKLFEERKNGGEGEGMDLLWETYEAESTRNRGNSKNKKNSKKKHEIKYREEAKELSYQEEDDESDGQLCCLQALKFSAGKMNLGMGRPNLAKISKAIKGIGWLHNLNSRHNKKVHNGDRF